MAAEALKKHRASCRGLTLVELMIALAITSVIAAAVVAMLGAVSSGLETRRDSRTHLVRANAAQIRLSAYIAPSHCVLHADNGNLVLWFHDERQSDTVHATDVRWLLYDDDQGVIRAQLVDFPANWTDAQRRGADRELSSTENWQTVRQFYSTNGWLSDFVLIDGLSSVSLTIDHTDVLEARHVTYRLATGDTNVTTLVTGTLRKHKKPKR